MQAGGAMCVCICTHVAGIQMSLWGPGVGEPGLEDCLGGQCGCVCGWQRCVEGMCVWEGVWRGRLPARTGGRCSGTGDAVGQGFLRQHSVLPVSQLHAAANGMPLHQDAVARCLPLHQGMGSFGSSGELNSWAGSCRGQCPCPSGGAAKNYY